MTLDPVGKAKKALDNINDCPVGLNRATLRDFLVRCSLRNNLRNIIAPIFYRLDRCDPERDHAPLRHLAAMIGSGLEARGNLTATHWGQDEEAHFGLGDGHLQHSRAMGNIIMASELLDFDRPPISAELAARADATRTFGMNNGGRADLREWFFDGVAYPPDEHFEEIGQTEKPYLLMNGDTDPQTGLTSMSIPYSTAVEGRSPRSRNFVMMDTLHGAILSSPVVGGGPDCGMRMMVSFLTTADAHIDTECLGRLLPPDYAASTQETREAADMVLGTTNAWD